MLNSVSVIFTRLRSNRSVRIIGRKVVRFMPDIQITRDHPYLGVIRLRLRRHRWLLLNDFSDAHSYMFGVFDRLVERGAVVYDIGANIGIYTRILINWFHASKVYAFEPMKDNRVLLKSNIKLGKLEGKVHVYECALGDRNGEEELQVDDVLSSTAVLDRVGGGFASEGRKQLNLPPITERVSVMKLDDLVHEQKLDAPNVIKIDTEGAEVLVLEGAQKTLEKYKPKYDHCDAWCRSCRENDCSVIYARIPILWVCIQ